MENNNEFMEIYNKVAANKALIEKHEREVDSLREANHVLLEDLKKIVKTEKESSSFKMNGKNYQIRCRNGVNFLVESEKPFGRKKVEKTEKAA